MSLADGLQIIATVILAFLAITMNRKLDKLDKRYDRSIGRMGRIRELLSEINRLISLVDIATWSNDDIQLGLRSVVEVTGLSHEVAGLAKACGGRIAEVLGEMDGFAFEVGMKVPVDDDGVPVSSDEFFRQLASGQITRSADEIRLGIRQWTAKYRDAIKEALEIVELQADTL